MKDIYLQIYSPVHKIAHRLFTEKGLEVFIKRDDLIHPIISGNKWRKLKYVLKKAAADGKAHLVTFGGAYSNHLLATAAAGALFGFKTTGFVRGEKVDNAHLFLCRLYGMALLFTDRESYRDKHTLFKQYFGDDDDAFFIDEGGASAEAVQGCSELIGELTEPYDHIFCACGTGTTAAGLMNGIAEKQLATTFHAVPVFKNGGFIAADIGRYLIQAEQAYTLHLDYHFGGYAKTTPALIKFIEEFVSLTGILVDPVYTGKMMYALFDQARQDAFKPGSRLLAIHTGGVWGLIGHARQVLGHAKTIILLTFSAGVTLKQALCPLKLFY